MYTRKIIKLLCINIIFLLCSFLAKGNNHKIQRDTTFLNWYQEHFTNPEKDSINKDSITNFDKQTVIRQLEAIESTIEFTYNSYVEDQIKRYIKWGTHSLGPIIGASRYYFPLIEEIFDAKGIPLEMKYLAIVESHLDPTAFSPMGAAGLWQFMYSTGKAYNLTINSLIDERRDPVKASYAAAEFLNDLYDRYGDWYLAIAAYNCGPGNVNKAIKRAGGEEDIWKIYPFLPTETRGYIPSFIAMTYVMEHHHQYGIQCLLPDQPLFTDTIHLSQRMNLQQASEVLDIPLSLLKTLNPQYHKNIIPANEQKTYALTLPLEYVSPFIGAQNEILNHRKKELVERRTVVAQAAKFSDFDEVDIAGKTKLYYPVKSGDNLGFIADWFDVGNTQLRRWNNLTKNTIHVGQKLLIYVPSQKKDHYAQFINASFEQKQAWAGNTPQKKQAALDPNYVYHQVKDGENPWAIAQQYEGISTDDILKLNPNHKYLKPGQYIKIKAKS